MKKLLISIICTALFSTFEGFSQEEKTQQKTTDSTKTKMVERDAKEDKNRNVMLNNISY